MLIIFFPQLVATLTTLQKRPLLLVLLAEVVAHSRIILVKLHLRPASNLHHLLSLRQQTRFLLQRGRLRVLDHCLLCLGWRRRLIGDPEGLLRFFALNLVEHIHLEFIIEFISQMSTKSPLRSVASMPKQPPAFDPNVYVTKNLPADDIMRLKECFDIFDYDKSGNVSTQELSTAIKALGLEKEAGKILNIVQSQSSDTEMDFEGFLQIFGFNGDSNNESSLQQLFEVFDKNNQGSFGVEEFTEICESVGERFSPTEIEQMIEYADKDRDGRISFQEFYDVVTKEYPQI